MTWGRAKAAKTKTERDIFEHVLRAQRELDAAADKCSKLAHTLSRSRRAEQGGPAKKKKPDKKVLKELTPEERKKEVKEEKRRQVVQRRAEQQRGDHRRGEKRKVDEMGKRLGSARRLLERLPLLDLPNRPGSGSGDVDGKS